MTAETIDASKLPRYRLGHRAPTWWGNLLFIIIEGASFLLLVASYLYVQSNEADWPPAPPMHLSPGLLSLAAFALSCVPVAFAYRFAGREEKGRTCIAMAVSVAFTLGTMPFRWHEIASLPFTWHDSAYGSIVWSLVGLHTIEAVMGIGELAFVTTALHAKADKRHFADVQLTALFWFFVAGLWLPLFALLYGDGAYG